MANDKDKNDKVDEIEKQIEVPAIKYVQQLIGMDKDKAIKTIEADGFVARIVSENGEEFFVSMDMCDNRVNLTLTDGKVVGVEVG
jgi:hypothetical protein